MNKVTRIQIKGAYRLEVEFVDGVRCEVDLSDRLRGDIESSAKTEAVFRGT